MSLSGEQGTDMGPNLPALLVACWRTLADGRTELRTVNYRTGSATCTKSQLSCETHLFGLQGVHRREEVGPTEDRDQITTKALLQNRTVEARGLTSI